MTLPDLANFSPDELDNFAQNNFMIYNWAMPPEDCEMIIKKFEQVVKYDKTQVDEFKTGRKNFTEIDIDKYGDSDFWREPKKKFVAMMEEYKTRFMKNLNIKDIHFPPVIDMENIRIKKYMPNDEDQFKVHVDVVRSMGDSAKRFLVIFIYLNTTEEGGETYFEDIRYNVKPEEAKMLMFPPHWTYPHAGKKVSKGVKYIIGTYLHYLNE